MMERVQDVGDIILVIYGVTITSYRRRQTEYVYCVVDVPLTKYQKPYFYVLIRFKIIKINTTKDTAVINKKQ